MGSPSAAHTWPNALGLASPPSRSGSGHGLPYQECPEPLRIAAQECEVPLLDGTRRDAVHRRSPSGCSRHRRGRSTRELQAAMELNPAHRGRDPLGSTGRAAVGVVGDREPRASCATARPTDRGHPGHARDGRRARVPPSMARTRGDRAGRCVGEFEVHTVGARIPLAYIVLGAEMDTRSRSSSTVLVSLIALDIERRDLSGASERQRRAQVFAQLLRPGIRG